MKPIILVEIAQLIDDTWQVIVQREDDFDDDLEMKFPTYRDAIAYAATIEVEGDEVTKDDKSRRPRFDEFVEWAHSLTKDERLQHWFLNHSDGRFVRVTLKFEDVDW